MQITRIIRIIFRIAIFILLLILAINNMQTTEFNFLGIYTLKLPLIVTIAIFTFLGVLLGMLFSFGNNLTLKSELKKARKQLTQNQQKNQAESNTNPPT